MWSATGSKRRPPPLLFRLTQNSSRRPQRLSPRNVRKSSRSFAKTTFVRQFSLTPVSGSERRPSSLLRPVTLLKPTTYLLRASNCRQIKRLYTDIDAPAANSHLPAHPHPGGTSSRRCC